LDYWQKLKYMKKLLGFILGLSVCTALSAQDFSIGPKIGISQGSINVSGDGFETGENKFGYHAGIFVRMGGDSFYIQPEFLYTNTGGSVIQKSASGPDVTLDASFNRLDVPFMLGFKLASIFRIQAGPIATILLDYQIADAVQVAQDLNYANATLGYQAGIGVDVGNLILDLKYENSLSRISKSVAGFDTDQRQALFMLSAGFRLF
jgi:hypothetical protein